MHDVFQELIKAWRWRVVQFRAARAVVTARRETDPFSMPYLNYISTNSSDLRIQQKNAAKYVCDLFTLRLSKLWHFPLNFHLFSYVARQKIMLKQRTSHTENE